MSESRRPSTERSTGRIEAFSDGVFAIAITLLILEVKVPHAPEAEPVQLLAALLGLWPSYLALALSFTMIGIYWTNHHYIFKLFEKTDHGLNLRNLLFLLCIFFLSQRQTTVHPDCTAVVAALGPVPRHDDRPRAPGSRAARP
jgi:TMEM175 potassium channel family protein